MPIICMFRGIKIYANYNEYIPPHFHAKYGEYECSIIIEEIELLNGNMPNKHLKMGSNTSKRIKRTVVF